MYYKSELIIRLLRGAGLVQYKKDEIKEKIDSAALTIFAEKGYTKATISNIAERAEISVGNFYRYYKGKEEIFASVLPESFWQSVQDQIFDKIGTFGREGISSEITQRLNLTSNRDFIRFLIENRERMSILLNGAQGTVYENVKTELIRLLINTVKNTYPEFYQGFLTSNQSDRVLVVIYENLINLYAGILKQAQTGAEVEQLLKTVNVYHLFGVTGLLGIKTRAEC